MVMNMKTLTIKFVVKDEDEADALLNEITEDIANGYGTPWISTDLRGSTDKEINV